jgi:hypothetical protein
MTANPETDMSMQLKTETMKTNTRRSFLTDVATLVAGALGFKFFKREYSLPDWAKAPVSATHPKTVFEFLQEEARNLMRLAEIDKARVLKTYPHMDPKDVKFDLPFYIIFRSDAASMRPKDLTEVEKVARLIGCRATFERSNHGEWYRFALDRTA